MTGGARGVGAAVAKALAEAGMTIAVHARADVDAAKAAVQSLTQSLAVSLAPLASPSRPWRRDSSTPT